MIVQKPQSQGITIDLTGPQGNAFYLLGTAKNLARQLDFNESFILNEMIISFIQKQTHPQKKNRI